ncbi:unnamed protein product [Lactuca virosa]|uniref:Uncharacterized protein n=1 Tax=Lactuca virosa TaxID=75947 RepID=A0AAU9NQ01_9ASTR|nr:unnamed protein product [Lactuca virosa]
MNKILQSASERELQKQMDSDMMILIMDTSNMIREELEVVMAMKANVKNVMLSRSAPTFVAFNHRNRLQSNRHQPSFCDTKLIGKIIRMMSGTIRRKALSLCSSAVANNAFGRGSKLVPEIHQGMHAFSYIRVCSVYSKALRDVSSFKTDFLTPKWVRSFSSHSGPTVCGDISEPIAQIQTDKVFNS